MKCPECNQDTEDHAQIGVVNGDDYYMELCLNIWFCSDCELAFRVATGELLEEIKKK